MTAPIRATDDVGAETAAHALAGRVALVTGGARGLGAAVADVLTEAGMPVAIGDIDATLAGVTADSLAGRAGECLPVRLDVADESSIEAAVDAAVGAFGRLDVVVNCAGIDVTAPFDDLAVADWDRILAVNLRGPILVAHAALPALRASGRGHIVNIASTAAKRAWPNATAYHATKWGLLGFSHALHAEARQYGVKVTAVVPGGMRTPFLLDRFPDLDPDALQDPRTVAETIRFVLTQPDGSVIPEVTVLPMRETSWP
jgi:NAD(P)-dependent dehydrogenase (short-subunit alcohol dehydrogenase family)